MKLNKENWKQELWIAMKYGFVGVLNTLVFTSLVFILSRTGLHYSIYTAISYTIAILFSFVVNMKFTFSKFPGKILPRAVKFISLSLSLMLIVQVIQYLIIDVVLWPELAGILTGMVFYTGTGYILNRLWVFK